jgi:DNA repair photolyase
VYCFARSTHSYFHLGAGEDFSAVIFVKRNLAEALEAQLARRSWRRELVAIGTATDPYQPAEGRYRLTRAALEVLARYRTPASIVTKGTMMVRDVDVLIELTARAAVTVCHSIPTVDVELWRRTEPGTPPPIQRLRALERLRANGIRAGVLMAPLLPGLSARPEEIAKTAKAAVAHGACFLGGRTLHLGPGTRENFFGFLDEEYPELFAEYERLYGGKYAPRWLSDKVEGHVQSQSRRYRLDERYPAPSPREPIQLTLNL